MIGLVTQNEALQKENETLQDRVKKAADEQEELRRSFYNELMSYKSAQMSKMRRENRRDLAHEDQIQISLFNTLEGIDKPTLDIINGKIIEVKNLAENKILKQHQQIDFMQNKLQHYEKLDAQLHMLFQLPIKSVFEQLPNIERSADNACRLFIEAYTEPEILPIMTSIFGPKLVGDKDKMKKLLDDINKFVQKELDDLSKLYYQQLIDAQLQIEELNLKCEQLEVQIAIEDEQLQEIWDKAGYERACIQLRVQSRLMQEELDEKIRQFEQKSGLFESNAAKAWAGECTRMQELVWELEYELVGLRRLNDAQNVKYYNLETKHLALIEETRGK